MADSDGPDRLTGPGWRRWLQRGAAGLVAAVAAYASYDHQRAFALEHGAHGIAAAVWPLSVDGLLILASVALLDPALSLARVGAAGGTGGVHGGDLRVAGRERRCCWRVELGRRPRRRVAAGRAAAVGGDPYPLHEPGRRHRDVRVPHRESGTVPAVPGHEYRRRDRLAGTRDRTGCTPHQPRGFTRD